MRCVARRKRYRSSGGPAPVHGGPTRDGGRTRQDAGQRRDPDAILEKLGPGRPLDGGARSRMESAFGRDLRHVRLHTDESADSLADDFGSAAFTVGDHIAIRPTRYRPGTPAGDALLAHEVAHTLQQQGANTTHAAPVQESALETDAWNAAYQAVASLWRKDKRGAAIKTDGIAPRLRSGTQLSLAHCGSAKKSTTACPVAAAFTNIPSGNVAPKRLSPDAYGAEFDMVGEFTPSGDGCNCSCGEYRQYMKGSAKVNGHNIPHPMCGAMLTEGTYNEDCTSDGSTNYRFGYRAHRFTLPFSTSKFEDPNQKEGCRFVGHDTPDIRTRNGAPLTPGDTLELDYGFKGDLIDTCQNGKVLATSEWTVKGTYTAP